MVQVRELVFDFLQIWGQLSPETARRRRRGQIRKGRNKWLCLWGVSLSGRVGCSSEAGKSGFAALVSSGGI